ncbi:hypothetical protein U1Q18_004241 [Sarracenia purpurea var. burkii]
MEEDDARSKGTVRWFDDQKCYDFISRDDGNKDSFIHQSTIRSEGFRTLQEGQVIKFLIALENGRTNVVDVTGHDGSSLERIRRDGYKAF